MGGIFLALSVRMCVCNIQTFSFQAAFYVLDFKLIEVGKRHVELNLDHQKFESTCLF